MEADNTPHACVHLGIVLTRLNELPIASPRQQLPVRGRRVRGNLASAGTDRCVRGPRSARRQRCHTARDSERACLAGSAFQVHFCSVGGQLAKLGCAGSKMAGPAAASVKPLVIVGPSGVGKGTLINKLMVRFPG